MPREKEVYRKTYDLSDNALQALGVVMDFYGEPTEVGALRKVLSDMAGMIQMIKAGGKLFIMDSAGQVNRVLIFENADSAMRLGGESSVQSAIDGK